MRNSKSVVTIDAQQGNSIIAVSIGVCDMFGYSTKEMIGRNVSMLMHPGFAKQHDVYISRFLTSGVPHVMDKARNVTGRRKDGKHINLKLSLSILHLEKQILIVGLLEEIEPAVCKFVANSSGSIEYASSNVLEVFGYHSRQLIGRNVSVLCPEPHRSLHDSYLAAYHLGGESRVLNRARNVNAVHASGAEFPISLQVRKCRDSFKARIFPLENVEVMVMVDEHNRVRSTSDKCRELFGRMEEELLDLDFDSLFSSTIKPSAMPCELLLNAELMAMDGSRVKVWTWYFVSFFLHIFELGAIKEEPDCRLSFLLLSSDRNRGMHTRGRFYFFRIKSGRGLE